MFTYERVTCLFKYQLDYIIHSASLEWVVDAELFFLTDLPWISVKKKKFTQLKFFSYLFALTQLSFIHLIF